MTCVCPPSSYLNIVIHTSYQAEGFGKRCVCVCPPSQLRVPRVRRRPPANRMFCTLTGHTEKVRVSWFLSFQLNVYTEIKTICARVSVLLFCAPFSYTIGPPAMCFLKSAHSDSQVITDLDNQDWTPINPLTTIAFTVQISNIIHLCWELTAV